MRPAVVTVPRHEFGIAPDRHRCRFRPGGTALCLTVSSPNCIVDVSRGPILTDSADARAAHMRRYPIAVETKMLDWRVRECTIPNRSILNLREAEVGSSIRQGPVPIPHARANPVCGSLVEEIAALVSSGKRVRRGRNTSDPTASDLRYFLALS
jgi:hypothetical protein